MNRSQRNRRRWLGFGLSAGVIAVLASLPARSLAQASDAATAEQASPAGSEPQILQESETTAPLTRAAPAGTGTAPQGGGQTAAALPEGKHPSEKQERKAEKLYLQGAKLVEQGDTRGAYQAFAAAAALDPANQQYLAAREIARQHLLTQLVQEAEKARLSGHPEVARQKLEEALVLDPKNPIITQHVDELVDERRISVEPVDEEGNVEGPIELTPAKVKKSFHLKGTQQEILRQVLSAYQITPVMDSSVTQKAVRLDADDVDWAQASQMVKMLTGTFFVPLDPRRVLVAKDTKNNRQQFERLLVESVYLPGLTATELTDVSNLAKNVFEAPAATLQADKGMLTVRAPESRMKALNATLEELLDGRAQVLLDVRLFDINHSRMTNIGVVLPSQITVFNLDTEINSLLQGNQAAIQQIIASGLAAPGDYGAILGILIATGQITSSILTEGFATFGGGLTAFGAAPGSLTANLSLNASDSRVLDDIQLRVQDQETATFRVGSRYPIVTGTFTSGAGGLSISGINSAGLSSTLNGLGINTSSLAAQTTIPQIQYQDLGLTLKATPRVQHSQEVALNMDLEFTALAGTTLDENPILNNRKYTATITLRDGSSALVVSSLSKQETKAVTGIPGLSELPGLRSTTNDDNNVNESSLIVLVTPHIIRGNHMNMAGRQIVFPQHD